ncbi:glycosyltransferase [Paenibacillus sp. TAB 01]|uniref:glycosyltransferase n=1 Tax=Paenibacillus sp. TAB 01 TaxID=3368988 RepID=UPI003752FC59
MNLLSTRNKWLATATVMMSLLYIIWRTFFTIPFGYGIVAVVSGLFLLTVEIIGMLEAGVHFYNMVSVEYPERPEVEADQFPHVDVFIATYNEPVTLLHKTINGCLNMDYPDKSKVHIYLCDDSNRPEMRELANRMKIQYVTRMERTHAKAGNLNNAMQHSSSPLIVTFDADMIPMHGFLMACVPYFLTGKKIGFVQTPQSFYNADQFQYNLYSEGRIPNEQDYFYRDVQVGRNKTNSVIYGGTNTVISRQALEEIGGFYTEVITEDFATGILIQSKGYKCYAINEVHASGLAPADLRSLIKQRERWARGCIQTGKKLNIFFIKGLTLAQRLNYISSISYWYSGLKRLIYIMSPILFTVFNVIVVKCTLLEVLIFWLPMYLLMNTCLRMLSRNIRNTKWSNVYETILFPSLLPVILLETFGISQKKFAVTRKDGAQNDRAYQWRQTAPHAVLAVLSVIGIVNCVQLTFATGSISFIVVIFWLLINFYNIIMSIFFMLGRRVYRNHERSAAQVDCTIMTEHQTIHCFTHDISEGGLSVLLDAPHYIPADKPVSIQLSTARYRSSFQGEVIHVDEFQGRWKYAFHMTGLEEGDFRQLLHMIYDREPTLPQRLDKDSSTFEDIRINFIQRSKNRGLSNRKLARIHLDRPVETLECGTVTLTDFNYQYIQFELGTHPRPAILTVLLQDGMTLECTLVSSHPHSKGALYLISGYEELAESGILDSIAAEWLQEKVRERQPAKPHQANAPSDELDEMAHL